MDAVNQLLGSVSNLLFGTVLIWLLLGVGAFLTIRTRGVQLRHLPSIVRAVAGSRSGAGGGISSFQAFAVGLACRVGTGNIVGVALALVLGGPGAVLWMWVVALLGTATAFSEATLGQLFKVRRPDGTFRGGPAYYLARGLGWPALGAVFAVVFMLANGLAMPMLQANAMTAALASASDLPPWWGAAVVAVLVAPVLVGGLRSIARVTEWLAPAMAIVYLLLVAVIIVSHPAAALQALGQIIEGAFGLRAGLAGVAGGLTQAVLNGVRRGLFSNEAGLGGSACAAGSATVAHPAQQGFIQAFGVLVDTLLICTATALAILIAGIEEPALYTPGITGSGPAGTPTGTDVSGVLTQHAVASVLGEWTSWPMTVLILVLAYSTILGAFSYAEVCLSYLTDSPWAARALRWAAVACAFIGGGAALTTVWTLADVLLGIGACLNLVAIVALSSWVVGALRDWESQRRAGQAPVFRGTGNPHLPGDLPGQVWADAAPDLRPSAAG